jgi:hypothetical protein
MAGGKVRAARLFPQIPQKSLLTINMNRAITEAMGQGGLVRAQACSFALRKSGMLMEERGQYPLPRIVADLAIEVQLLNDGLCFLAL